MHTILSAGLITAILLFLVGTHEVETHEPSDPGTSDGPEPSADENDPRWHDDVRRIVAEYRAWQRLDDEARFAPFLCRMPRGAEARFSEARGRDAHADKLYTLYARDPVAYGAPATVPADPSDPGPGGDDPLAHLDQVIVKEAWVPRSLGTELTREQQEDRARWGRSQLRPAQRRGHWWCADEPAGLFLMFQSPDSPHETDAGWVYATVDADGETITGAGRMDRCMRCHTREEDRLFGLPTEDADADPAAADENDPRWHDRVLAVAREYRRWRRLDDMLRVAPTLCSMPPAPPARASRARDRRSAEDPGATHAEKLYTLYAKDPVAYGAKPSGMIWEEDAKVLAQFDDLEQVIVKEAWKPVSLGTDDDDPRLSDPRAWGPSRLRPTRQHGHWWRAGEAAGLFLMIRPGETERPTDAGWIYATVTPDGETVTGAGRMDSCMRCHARHEDRLFGLPEED